MSRSPLRHAFVVTVTAASLSAPVACSNEVAVFDQGSPPEQPLGCPATAPAEASACDAADLRCTYGAGCDAEAYRCTAGSWAAEALPGCSACPSAVPASGSPCAADGLQCDYGDDGCGFPEQTASCDEGSWTVFYNSCNPPPPFECPPELPVDGTDCVDAGWGEPGTCDYEIETPDGFLEATAACDYHGEGGITWSVTFTTEPTTPCGAFTSRAACVIGDACRWLVPGCGAGTETVTPVGCYPVDDCTPGACADGETCTTTVYDPCAFSDCAACGAEAQVCLSP